MSTKDFASMLADARLPERTVEICMRGDLVAVHEDLERQLDRARKRGSDSLAGEGVGDLVDRIEAIEAQMAECVYPFRVRALPKPAWRALVAAHPPRQGPDGGIIDVDAALGLNTETFWDDMVRACLVDPVVDDTAWSELVAGKLTDRQLGELADASWAVNRGTVDVPFSRVASLLRKPTADE